MRYYTALTDARYIMNNSDSNLPIQDGLTKSTSSGGLKARTDAERSTEINTDQYSKTAAKNARKMAKRTYVDESPIHGKGLFAAKRIKAGVVLGRLHGMLTDKDGTYILWLNKRTGFEITNEFRFINHDSNPNCALTDTEVVTLRAIEKDEELTHDYGWE